MAVPASGPISINDLKTAFPAINSNNLAAYRGTKWYRSNNSRGFFGNPTISMSESYDTRPTSPVVAGSATYYGSTNFTIPLFNTLSITCKGGDGGQAGSYGVYYNGGPYNGTPTPSSGGGAGGTSYFGGYLSAGGGGGGGGNGGGGSAGATTSTALYITDSNQSNVSIQGTTITIGVGGGGGGGGGGALLYWNTWISQYQNVGAAGSGASGAGGYVSVSWS